MNAFEIATTFFHACETPLGWQGCKQYVADDAGFVAQSEPLVDIDTVAAYCDWMQAFGTITAPQAHYDLHTSSFDQDSNTAVFFGTYHAKHTGEGGPVPPTHKQTASHYVYVVKMNSEAKVEHLTKIWNAPWALKELGWM